MEFYALGFGFFDSLFLVSIPNGMEFYFVFEMSEAEVLSRFNSQRDGILRDFALDKLFEFIQFQFPTGWNSTQARKAKSGRSKLFQFPTGWNSTLRDHVSVIFRFSFNSQRDGILHCLNGYECPIGSVSILNGMEFYQASNSRRAYG